MDGVNAALLSNAIGVELTKWVKSGGVLFFACSPKVTNAWTKHTLGSILPATFKSSKEDLLEGIAVRDHAITRNLGLESMPLTVSKWLSVEAPHEDQILLSVGGEPMLLIKKVKEGTVLLWASTTDPRWNNWAQHPSFPLFWSNIVVYAISGDTAFAPVGQANTRALWRATVTPAPSMKVYYVNNNENEPATLPAALQKELGQSTKAYRDYHRIFLASSLLLALGYIWFETFSRRRATK